jgi:Asp-tRNA(Asn)/Glu-tRNA(Gln) amidotransferase A subunit family amidase
LAGKRPAASLQLIGKHGEDENLLATARMAEELLA